MSTQIQDGTVKWETKDIRVKAIVDLLYPVGTVIAVANNNTPAFTKYVTWEKIGSGRVLWGADSSHSAGSTIEAGLPNITGQATWTYMGSTEADDIKTSGAFTTGDIDTTFYSYTTGNSVKRSKQKQIKIDASKSNNIYGSSTTVRPPAYAVNFWRRTA